MSNSVGLYTSLTGIRAAQIGLDTASNNVANANTAGYTRQRVELRDRPPYASAIGPLGTGVDVVTVRRLRDAFLDTRLRTTTAGAAGEQARAELLGTVEAITGEPDAGISVELDQLWDAFEDLTLEPTSPAVKQQVVSALQSVADRINGVSAGWTALEADAIERRAAGIDEVNALVTAIEDINRQVEIPDPGNEPVDLQRFPLPNQLLDERDRLLDRLVELTGTGVTRNNDRTVTLPDPLDPVAGGELGGVERFLTTDLATARTQLDAFTTELVAQLNGAPGGQTLLDGTAGSLTVPITATALLAGDTAVGAYDTTYAEALAGLRNGTPAAELRTLVTGIGQRVASAERSAAAQSELVHAAQMARRSAHGVSIDEEMISLVSYQRALEAASRVMTTIDQALDVLVNRTGVVGR